MKSLTRNCIIMKNQISNYSIVMLILFTATSLIVSCGSFSAVSYYNDGIYGDVPPPQKKYSKSSNGKYYKNYFGEKAEELADNNQNIVLDTLATDQSSNGNAGTVNINVYGYGSHGIYNDYDHFYWNSYYQRPWWRHHRYRPWNYWSYHYEPYYYGWSYYNPYYSYYSYHYRYDPYYNHYGNYYYSNPNQYVRSAGRRGLPAGGNNNLRSNSSNSVDGQGYSVQRRTANGNISTTNYNVGRRSSNKILNTTSAQNTTQQNKSSVFMTQDYSNKRNYRSISNLNSTTNSKSYSKSNNTYQSRQTRNSNNNFNSSRPNIRSYSSGSSRGTISSSSSTGSSSRSSSSGRR